MSSTVVHVLRHGEVYNPARVLYGRLPGYRLSPLGEQMAELAAKALAGHDVTHVVSSPLERAQQTAVPFAEQFAVDVVTDDRLIESENFFEGKAVGVGDGTWRHPRYWHKLRNPFAPSWGEPYGEVALRMLAAVKDARRAAEGHEALLVSHQLPIWTLRRALENKPLWHNPGRRECALASITTVHFDGAKVTGVSYRDPAAPLIAKSKTAQTERGA